MVGAGLDVVMGNIRADMIFFFFFFQAEDGIRDRNVTGVQTCALPISAARAVGAANGANPVCIVLPCHRVIGSNGSLTGFGGELPVKQWLLDHEARVRSEERRVGKECRSGWAA